MLKVTVTYPDTKTSVELEKGEIRIVNGIFAFDRPIPKDSEIKISWNNNGNNNN